MVLGRSTMVLGRSTMVLGRSTMVLGRSTMVLGRSTMSSQWTSWTGRSGGAWRISASQRQTNNHPNIEPSRFSNQWLDWGVWQIWSSAIRWLSPKCKNIDKMFGKLSIKGWFYFTLAGFIAFGEYHIYIPATPLSIISLAQERPVTALLHIDHEYYQEQKKLMNSSMLRLVYM